MRLRALVSVPSSARQAWHAPSASVFIPSDEREAGAQWRGLHVWLNDARARATSSAAVVDRFGHVRLRGHTHETRGCARIQQDGSFIYCALCAGSPPSPFHSSLALSSIPPLLPMSAGSKRGSDALGSDEAQSVKKKLAKAEDDFKEASKALVEVSKALVEAEEDHKKAEEAHDAIRLDVCQKRGLLQWADTQSDIDFLNFVDYAEAAIASNSAAPSATGDEEEEAERVAAALASAQAAVRAKRSQVKREEAQSDFISAYGVAMLQKQE
jgi:hypothetical protein